MSHLLFLLSANIIAGFGCPELTLTPDLLVDNQVFAGKNVTLSASAGSHATIAPASGTLSANNGAVAHRCAWIPGRCRTSGDRLLHSRGKQIFFSRALRLFVRGRLPTLPLLTSAADSFDRLNSLQQIREAASAAAKSSTGGCSRATIPAPSNVRSQVANSMCRSDFGGNRSTLSGG